MSGSERAPKPSLYPSPTGEIRCNRCGGKATKGYEGASEYIDFCNSCFRAFESWLREETDD